ncbi:MULTISPECIES: glycyl-radical enzyme activating protein [Coprobacillaceae]|uniref:glycyl-radical enzyme activating protein n=2 Tax=Coprobacillaceae TaxID=2810280 RepID=UPI0018F78960|nr:glycyl-radical enzyme activating protein [Erysipelatoclostridium sp. AM42-17]
MKGIIFNIQKFSLHDGPGIRTTVFFKGCPLKCKWCSNPESQFTSIQILHDQIKCQHCLQCIHTCKNNALSLKNDMIEIDNSKCMGCLECVHACPFQALSFEGEYKSIKEIVETCMQDYDFYEESQGGITISGGEGMSQPAFLKQLVTELKQHHLHVAIETTGYIEPKLFKELAPMFDLLLFDCKHYDSKRHFIGTGVYNEMIIENLTWATKKGLNILVRIPVIPEFNCTLQDAKGFCQLFNDIGIKKVQLLPFHQFGEKKYNLLHRPYTLKNKKALYKEDLKDYQQVFINSHIDCFF